MEYETSDLYFASLLLALGYKLVSLRNINKRRIGFKFIYSEDQDDPDTIYDQYYENNIKVDAKTYTSAIKEIKTRLYNYSSTNLSHK